MLTLSNAALALPALRRVGALLVVTGLGADERKRGVSVTLQMLEFGSALELTLNLDSFLLL